MIPVYKPPILDRAEQSLVNTYRSGWWAYGPLCGSLEKTFCEERGGWTLATSSCTTALYITALLLRKTPNDEVIVPAVTFASTAMAFLAASFAVKVADVCDTNLMINKDTVSPLLSKNTRAIIAVHLYGQRAPLEELREICSERGLLLIEDCAHRIDLGSTPLGDFACYSFNAVKEVPAGEGGLIWGRDYQFEDRARAISYVGMNIDPWQRSRRLKHLDYEFSKEVGLKLRLNDIAAAQVNEYLACREGYRQVRKEIFQRYDQLLSELSPVVIPLQRNCDDSYLMYVVRVKEIDRDLLRADLANSGVATSVHYDTLTIHSLLAEHRCPIAEKASRELVTLPCFPDLSAKDQSFVSELLKSHINNLAMRKH